MSHTLYWSIVLAKIDLVALYFRLLWYHSILRGSIDQKHAKTNEIWRQNSEIHPAFACSRWPPWFPDLSRPYGACVKRGSGKHMFGLSPFSSPEPLDLICNRLPTTWPKNDGLWRREWSQSFSLESAVKYLHVGRRKIQISPPLGEQDQSSALPQGQQRQSNPRPMPCLPSPRPAGIPLIGA